MQVFQGLFQYIATDFPDMNEIEIALIGPAISQSYWEVIPNPSKKFKLKKSFLMFRNMDQGYEIITMNQKLNDSIREKTPLLVPLDNMSLHIE